MTFCLIPNHDLAKLKELGATGILLGYWVSDHIAASFSTLIESKSLRKLEKPLGPWMAGQSPRGSMRHLLTLVHVLDMCFTLSTFRVCEDPDVPADVLELGFAPLLGGMLPERDVLPVIATSCPTCLLNFELSP